MRTFYTEHGKIVFTTDKILIEDNAKKEKTYQILAASCGIIVGFSQIFNSFGSDGWFSLGVAICLINGAIIIAYLFRSSDSEIPFSEIKSIRVKNRLGNLFLDIKLKNKKSRQVRGSFTREPLEIYIAEVFPT
ncbi:hypothetical protein [Mongoliitalea daihaiensis]|uniref:hypothetical protein n=1 Tax=Mongoliitalea daihaiensis TaxID=2782006 RepID=UPI001F426C25|nr:hypothetical protein [Mongoliitalea daihaiensis]UJP65001.1 hypothetical protein IPZ59_19850 [Mongoliitalea daihaiensis]